MLTIDKLKKKLDVLNDEITYLQGLIKKYSELSYVTKLVTDLEENRTVEIIDTEQQKSLFITNVKGNISYREEVYHRDSLNPHWCINTRVLTLDEVKSFVCQLRK